MNTPTTTNRHPLHALYLGWTHGEASTLPRRARLAQGRTAAASLPAATDGGSTTLLAGLGLAAAVAVARLVSKLIDGR